MTESLPPAPPSTGERPDTAGAAGLPPPRAPRKRRRPLPPAGESLCVEDPKISEVLDTDSGDHVRVQDVIGNDFGSLIQLRMRVKAANAKEQPFYRCSICATPVFLCGTPDRVKFFFKHTHEDGSCPAVTRGELNRDEIDARKYNGVKESRMHRDMKDWLEASLKADLRFSNVQKEVRWTGKLTGAWRKPDVSAEYKGIRVAFEIQLTTTYLDVIVQRRAFYLEEGGLLFWVFASFDNEHRRLTEDDVFYNNNQNAFIFNQETTKESLEEGRLMLECAWQAPTLDGSHGVLRRQRVAFDELVLEPETQRAYFFDYDGEKLRLISERNSDAQLLRDDVEAWWHRRRDEDVPPQQMWVSLAPRLRKAGVPVPYKFGEVDIILITALYSAKNNRPWGQRKKRLVEVAHHLAIAERDRFVWFMHAVRKYGREKSMAGEGDTAAWAAKYRQAKDDYRADKTPFLPERKSQALAEFLFPELVQFPEVGG